jgi:3-ketoacyl-CoA synthase
MPVKKSLAAVLLRDACTAGLDDAAVECRMALCGALEGLLHKTGLTPNDIDILVTTCSIYCPTPSMASMVVNYFKMKPSVQSYSLGGMGCSNGVVSINMIRDLLKARPNSNAVLLTTETTTPVFYPGKDKHRMVSGLTDSTPLWRPQFC